MDPNDGSQAPVSRFRSPHTVLASADRRVVRLHFTNTADQVELFAHPCVLSTWSRVLRNVLEDSLPVVTDVHGSSSGVQQITIPLDDDSHAAWEDALSLMYPSVPLFAITWDNAARLLLLADKYDMACLAEHVKAFLDTPQCAFTAAQPHQQQGGQEGGQQQQQHQGQQQQPQVRRQLPQQQQQRPNLSRLEAQLTDGSMPGQPCVFEWLRVTSQCGLEQHAQVCIKFIVQRQLAIPAGLISTIRMQHADQLLSCLQQALQQVRPQALEGAALPEPDGRCGVCFEQWFRMPGTDSPASYCLSCGCNMRQYPDGTLAVASRYQFRLDSQEELSSEEDGASDGELSGGEGESGGTLSDSEDESESEGEGEGGDGVGDPEGFFSDSDEDETDSDEDETDSEDE